MKSNKFDTLRFERLNEIPAYVPSQIGQQIRMPCMHCETKKEVSLQDSRTQYVDMDGYYDWNSNMPIPLCCRCAEEHHECWDDMWIDYFVQVMMA